MKKAMSIFALILQAFGYSQNPLFIPDTLSGPSINLSLQNGQVEFYPGFSTNTIGYNQTILGKTVILEKGNGVTLNVTNNLDEPTTLHWHGLHVSPENDGGPHTVIKAGETWSPSFTVLNHAATYWYHPHLHEHTAEQVTRGAAGFIIVRDNEEAKLNLPRSYGIDDFPIVIQSRAFDSNKQLLWDTPADDVIMCNGTLDAYLDVPAQIVRLRLLNGSTERVYNLGFQSNVHFHQIASDGGLLNAPVSLTRLILAPGERAEILLDLSNLQGQTINLMSFASELPHGTYGAVNPSVMPMGSIAGYGNNPLNGNDFSVMQIKVDTPTSNPVTDIPLAQITNVPYLESDVNVTRNLLLHPAHMGPHGMLNGPFEINGQAFDLEVINFEIPINNTEVWELTNRTAIAHPFHIHDVQFYILEINGKTPPTHMQGKKDVVLVPPMFGSVRFITKFENFVDGDTPYMYHCHMLSHEDDGMMGQFLVLDNTTSTHEQSESSILIYPNPVADIIHLKGLPPSKIELYNTSGQILEKRKSAGYDEQFNLAEFASGIYYFNIKNAEQNYRYKVVKL